MRKQLVYLMRIIKVLSGLSLARAEKLTRWHLEEQSAAKDAERAKAEQAREKATLGLHKVFFSCKILLQSCHI